MSTRPPRITLVTRATARGRLLRQSEILTIPSAAVSGTKNTTKDTTAS